jgi:hypothetical protein
MVDTTSHVVKDMARRSLTKSDQFKPLSIRIHSKIHGPVIPSMPLVFNNQTNIQLISDSGEYTQQASTRATPKFSRDYKVALTQAHSCDLAESQVQRSFSKIESRMISEAAIQERFPFFSLKNVASGI